MKEYLKPIIDDEEIIIEDICVSSNETGSADEDGSEAGAGELWG